MVFKDRIEAGRRLADKLSPYKNQKNTIILALPRGGVVIGAAIARSLNLPLDIIITRKIGAPGNEEYAIGAITETGEGIFDQEAIAATGASKSYLKQKIAVETKEAQRRLKLYRGKKPNPDLKNKTIILVDDGIATGLTVRAAVQALRTFKPKRLIVAAPVIAQESLKQLQLEADDVIYLDSPFYFGAVGAFYENFSQTTDQEVINLIKKENP